MRRVCLATVLLLLGCRSTSSNSGTRRTPERAAAYERSIEKEELKLGMSRAEVVRAWGRPRKKDRAKRGGVSVERWWYPSVFVYFSRDGYVSSWDAPW